MSTDIRRLQAQVKTLRNQLRDSEKARVQLENTRDISKLLKDSKNLKGQPSKVKSRAKHTVLLCSDWHVEEHIDKEKVSSSNEFSLSIARKRIAQLFADYATICTVHKVSSTTVWLGGDLLSNTHHDELMEVSETRGPAETMVWLYQVIKTELLQLQRRLKIPIMVVCSYGNHGRLTAKPRIQTGAENSLEWLLYKHLEMELPKGITVLATKGQLTYLNILGHNVRFTHGDAIKGGQLGSSVMNAVKAWDSATSAAHTYVGHWHQYTPHTKYTINGSLIGYGPYSVRICAAYERPCQAWSLWTPDGLEAGGRILLKAQ